MSELLPAHLLELLDADEARDVEDALAASPRLREERAALEAVLGAVAFAVPPVAPSPGARARLLAAVDGEHRYAPLQDRLAALFDLTSARIQALLALIPGREAWTSGPCDGVSLLHFEAGPRALAVDAGFVRLAPGVEFPTHRHLGRERALVLEGAYLEVETGQVVRAGEAAERLPGSTHTFRALPGADLVFAVVLEGPIEIGGQRFDG
jgi:anti-sigma factor ChrR (cupin superfamily)